MTMVTLPVSTVDNGNVFEDLSGTDSTTSDNPFDPLIEACRDAPVNRTSDTMDGS